MSNAIIFDTKEWYLSHGSNPRGRGSWAFTFDTGPDYDVLRDVVFTPSMTYGEARKWARAEAVRRNATLVRVCP